MVVCHVAFVPNRVTAARIDTLYAYQEQTEGQTPIRQPNVIQKLKNQLEIADFTSFDEILAMNSRVALQYKPAAESHRISQLMRKYPILLARSGCCELHASSSSGKSKIAIP